MNKLAFAVLIICFHFQLIGQDETDLYTREELSKDLEYLVLTLENIHPNIYAYSNDSLNISEIESKFNDQMSAREFALLVAPKVISLQDGHTKLDMPRNGNNDITVFPLKIKIYNNKIYSIIDLGETNFPTGKEITYINDIPSDELITKLCEYINGEERSYKLGLAEQVFSYFLWKYLDFKNDFTIKYINEAGIENSELLKGVPMNIIANTYPSTKNRFEILDNSIGYLKIASFQGSAASFEEYIQGVFKELNEKEISNLIVDIRENGGGNIQLGNILFSYIYNYPFVPFSKYEVKASVEYKNYLSENSVWYYNIIAHSYMKYVNKVKRAEDNSIITFFEKETKPSKKFNFQGKVCLLTNSLTYSSANTFATMFRDYKAGEIWGKPTGGLATTYSDRFDFCLPNTKLNATVSSQKYYRPIEENGNGAILPDNEIDNTIEDDVNKYDRQLEILLNSINGE